MFERLNRLPVVQDRSFVFLALVFELKKLQLFS